MFGASYGGDFGMGGMGVGVGTTGSGGTATTMLVQELLPAFRGIALFFLEYMFDPVSRRSPGVPLPLNTTTTTMPHASTTTSTTTATTSIHDITSTQSPSKSRDDVLETAHVLHTGPTTSPENRLDYLFLTPLSILIHILVLPLSPPTYPYMPLLPLATVIYPTYPYMPLLSPTNHNDALATDGPTQWVVLA